MLISIKKIILCSLLLLTFFLPIYSSHAAEEYPKIDRKLAHPPDKIVRVLDKYRSTSKSLLKSMDKLMSSGNKASPKWKQHCNKIKGKLKDAEKALAKYKSRPDPKELPTDFKAYGKWMASEKEAWKNICSIGNEMIKSHDWLLSKTDFLDEEIERVGKQNTAMVVVEGQAEVILSYVISAIGAAGGTPVPPDQNKLIRKKLLGFMKKAKKYEDIYQDERERAKDLRKQFLESKLKSEIRQLERKKLDPDQRGVFVRHEKYWEKALWGKFKTFKDLLETYEERLEPLIDPVIDVELSYLKVKKDKMVDAFKKMLKKIK